MTTIKEKMKNLAKFLKEFFTIKITDETDTPMQSFDYLSRCDFMGYGFFR